MIPGDQATVTVLVAVPPEVAFAVFTEQTDAWWRHGPRFRVAGRSPGTLHFEAGAGGRLFESFTAPTGAPHVVEMGRITVWEPPSRLVFEWRAGNFDADEKTEVEVRFAPSASGTQVSVVHRGWASIRADHPARHGLAAAPFLREMGMWWADLLSAYRERARAS